MRIHLIGVAGSGMSGIAGLLLELGHRVSGSDKVTTVEVQRLQKLGLDFHCPHDASQVRDADLVIFSSAIKPGNPAYDEAVRNHQAMVRRADALAAVMNCKKGIVIAGMHGKTTTSSMMAHALRVGGLKPSHYVGAEIPILGTNAHWDPDGEYFVAEGDESDGTIVLYHPEHTILLNVEAEHLDFYENLEAIEAVYAQLLDQTTGKIIYCADDPVASQICAGRSNTIPYGRGPGARYRFGHLEVRQLQSHFSVFRDEERLGEVMLNVPGRHNVSNAIAVIALATELGVGMDAIGTALASFSGARRRFEVKFRGKNFMVVDDYAHHPSELRATLSTASDGGSKRTIVMFQPHRYSRTLALKEDFGRAFTDADAVFVTDIYAASEKPIEGVSGQTIVDAIKANGHSLAHYVADRKKLVFELGRILRPGDCILSLGAGNIHEQASVLARDLEVLEQLKEVMGTGEAGLYELMSKHTTLRCGGPVQFWLEPDTEEGMARLVKHCREAKLPLTVLGRGSNLLVRDGGIRGVVIHPVDGRFERIEVNGLEITAGAGVKLKQLAYAARDADIGGFEWMEGIPGNVGGALRMNAGAMGAETFDQVVSVRYIDSEGTIRTATPDQMEVHYRSVPTLIDNYAVAATFRGRESTPEEIKRGLDESMHKRKTSQPAASSAGCVFKNPEECPAGKLVDQLGLKNLSVGQARVSDVHGNFIVNDGGASAQDVLDLIAKIKEIAARERGIELHTEVQVIGEERSFHE